MESGSYPQASGYPQYPQGGIVQGEAASAQSRMRDWAAAAGRAAPQPDNVYTFTSLLLTGNRESDDITQFRDIVDMQLMLANFSDKEEARLFQDQANNLVAFLQMARGDPDLMEAFHVLYYQFDCEMKLTRAKEGGMERRLCATVGTQYVPQMSNQGFVPQQGYYGSYYGGGYPSYQDPYANPQMQQPEAAKENPIQAFIRSITKGK